MPRIHVRGSYRARPHTRREPVISGKYLVLAKMPFESRWTEVLETDDFAHAMDKLKRLKADGEDRRLLTKGIDFP